MKKILALLFSFNGRVSRTVWWMSVFIWWAFIAAGGYLDTYLTGEKEVSNYMAIVCLVSLWPLLAFQVKRWHDRNKDALWILIGIIPVIGFIWCVIELGCLGPVELGPTGEKNEY